MIDKQKLDELLRKHKAQPAGNGYIDVIVARGKYEEFLRELFCAGFTVSRITWWEYSDTLDNKTNYGMGGPPSWYYPGWFSEICAFDDELEGDARSTVGTINQLIENKTMVMHDGTINYKDYPSLTPAFWIDVPDDWRNEHSRPVPPAKADLNSDG